MSNNHKNKKVFFCCFGSWWVTDRYNWGVIALLHMENLTFPITEHAQKFTGKIPTGAKKHFVERFNFYTWKCIFNEFSKKAKKGMRRRYLAIPKKQPHSIEAFLVRETDLIPF